jgi:hypothetical protein
MAGFRLVVRFDKDIIGFLDRSTHFTSNRPEKRGMIAPTVGWLALLLPLDLAPKTPTPTETGEPVTLNGRVIELTAAPRSSVPGFDEEPIAKQVVLQGLQGREGTPTLLLSEERLRDRPAQIKARRHPSSPYVQVVTFRIEEDGRLRTPEYISEVCTISVRYPQICPCCQGPMEPRMRPDAR